MRLGKRPRFLLVRSEGFVLPEKSSSPVGPQVAEQVVSHAAERRAVAAAAFVFAIGTFASRILGLIRDMMTAKYFPIEVRDAFIVAFRLPNLFRRLLGEGALSVSFIPVFVELLSRPQGGATVAGASEQTTAAARRLVGSMFTILLTVTTVLTALGVVFMEDVLRLLLSGEGYASVPGKFELTVKLARIMFGFLMLITLYAYFMAILNSLRKFALTALAPCFFNLALIAAAFISPNLAAPEEVLAWSVIVGGVLQMGVLLPSIIKAGYLPRFTYVWKVDGVWLPLWKIKEVGRVFKAILPSLFGMSILQLTAVVNVHFASHLPQGAHSYLYLADRILELPLALFAVSVGSAILPTLSAQWARGDRDAMSATLSHAMRLIAFVALPSAIGMFILSQPITEVLFLGREFKFQDALATAEVIQVYAFGLLISAGVRIMVQGFYSVGNTWYPALVGAISLVSHVVFAWAGTRAFGLKGLAGATVASSLVNLIMLSVAYSRWLGTLHWAQLGARIVRFALCGILLGLGCLVYEPIVTQFGSRFVTRSLALFLSIALGGGLYMAAAAAMGLEEYRETTARVLEKFARKLRSVRRA